MAFNTNKDASATWVSASEAAKSMAVLIERDLVDKEDWEFLCWVAEPKIDLDRNQSRESRV